MVRKEKKEEGQSQRLNIFVSCSTCGGETMIRVYLPKALLACRCCVGTNCGSFLSKFLFKDLIHNFCKYNCFYLGCI